MTYHLVTTNRTGTPYPGIKCLACGRISYNPYDIAERYCGHCHTFHDDNDGLARRVNPQHPEPETSQPPSGLSARAPEETR